MFLDQKSILVLVAVAATIFALALMLGTLIFGSPRESDTGANSSISNPSMKNADSSPLAAATSKIAALDVQRLIMESAAAEVIEQEEHRQEEDALKHGDKKLALHLRGALVPGDPNYNPHHHIDDTLDVDDPLNSNQEIFGGEDLGDGDAKGESLAAVRQEKQENLIENMHHQFAQALEHEKLAINSAVKEGVSKLKETAAGVAKKVALRGSITKPETAENLPNYPYMKTLVPVDYDFTKFQPLGGNRFVEYLEGDSPYAITDSLREQSDNLARSRRVHVVNAMKHVWKNYKQYAFGMDELHPISKRGSANWGGMGTTLVDALDTLWLMGMKDEFWDARDWVRDHLSHDSVGDVSGFETTIRSLGGLLSAYDLSGDKVFLEKADDLGAKLFKAYDTPSGLPRGSVNLQSGRAHNMGWNGNSYILAEVGTQQIEYRYLANATGKQDYAKKSEKVFDILDKITPDDGLLFEKLKDEGKGVSFVSSKTSFGACGDSAYEYMIKLWIQGGRKEKMYRKMWDKAMNGLHDQLVQKSKPNGLTYIADRTNGRLDHKMDHLVCFMGGSLALGAYTDPLGIDSSRAKRDLKTAKALTYTCYQMYARTKTGISPEFVQFSGGNDFKVPASAPFYILRPEVVEAFYYLNVLTGDPVYREWGWEVFQSIEKYCKTKYGYGSLHDVNNPLMEPEDRMESFFLAETLKYLYLLFDPDSEIDILKKHVFNTEAHPVKIFDSQG
ncbi:hypothetical protein ACHAXM_010194 [Skeletonema potamos]